MKHILIGALSLLEVQKNDGDALILVESHETVGPFFPRWYARYVKWNNLRARKK